jgi:hypothetical protein
MRSGSVTFLAAFLAGITSLPAAVPSTNSTLSGDFSSFKVIAEKNIFNQSRYARTSSRSEPREVRRTAPSDSLQLTGVLSYEKGDLAFFEGTRSEYQRVARLGDKLAGFSITLIGPSGVVLSTTTNKVTLPVGKQLRRHDDEWEVADRTDTGGYSPRTVVAQAPPQAPAMPTPDPNSFDQSSGLRSVFGEGAPPMPPPGEGGSFPPQPSTDGSAASPQPQTQPPEAAPAAAGSEDEVLRRLMQRREQEINR